MGCVPNITIPQLQAMKGKEKIVALSLYTQPMAQLCDPIVDIILVGDSLGMVLYGFDSTLPVTLDMMIQHGRAVATTTTHALSVIDMPFGTVENNINSAIKNCHRVLDKTGAKAVKIEGGQDMAKTISAICEKKIPVMGHIGMLPQRAKDFGGFKTQGLESDSWQNIINDAIAIEKAGVFAIVIESVVADLASEITKAVKIPTIGIGASKICDGQILVADDMLGLTYHQKKSPRFVRRFTELDNIIIHATKHFATSVKGGDFPNDNETYKKIK
ncbi:MAG: 3-methyl-2-oxobutanoate hydroxymethyltransferase [Alphaproteobacteria bacterium]